MKAVIYYSLDGNTDLIAKEIAKKTGAELIRLHCKKEYPANGFKKFIWGGKSVVFGEKPKLQNKPVDLSLYKTIIIGTPIWAGTFAPPILTFLGDYDLKGKQIYLFACHGGGGAEKCFAKIKSKLIGSDVMGTADFIVPSKNPREKWNTTLENFCKKISKSK